ncbi:A/G-specific adenine glycosylase [Muricauda sp. 2012CJ35-5]|uniref:Adenine DNA glycosylase n=1 Tax=Flagellimonas spongiicola TaxID=2942208 RepID=A0ABT0PRI2_9FLAO|nr:A/G-specific adenine glycosylase [Allomuricauda spongiicola]MCL6273993.1 A/G-specific adenine glycosylase [Allomuricauda spongiicola]
MSFSQIILEWYGVHKRDLPWRTTINPYNIWLSEIMLQQTRVAQGIPYYNKFLEAFPTVHDLARAPEEKVLKLWQGLGYYSRARNLHTTAKIIVDTYSGEFPTTYKEVLTLKGIGDYTASAIVSICFNQPEPVVDGNVYRVLARYFGVDMPINSTSGIKYFKSLAREVMDIENIRDYNQGIMEFGAIQCAPKSPDCDVCPLNHACVALKEDRVRELPVKLKKAKIKSRYFNYLVFIDEHGKTLWEQRKGKGIWQNMYQFPLMETDQSVDVSKIRELAVKNIGVDVGRVTLYNTDVIIHKLSHQHLYTQFWVLESTTPLTNGISWQSIFDFPVPVLISDFIKTFKI